MNSSSCSNFDTYQSFSNNINKFDGNRYLALKEYDFTEEESSLKRKFFASGNNISIPAKPAKKTKFETPSSNRPPLYDAICSRDLKLVQYYLEAERPGIDKAISIDQRTPLHLAVQAGDKAIIQVLLNYGFRVNVEDSGKMTPLHLAVEFGSRENVRLLLNNGANVNLMNKSGFTALHLAVKNCNSKLLKANSSWMNGDFITEAQAKTLNDQNFYNRLGIVEELLECRSTDINLPCVYGKTALYYACTGIDMKYATKLVELILRYGANVNVSNMYGRTALSISMTYGCVDIVEALLKKGVNCNFTLNAAGLTPILWGISRGVTEMVNLLLKYCTFDVNSKTLCPQHGSLLHYAAEFSSVGSVRALVNAGADVRICNQAKLTPFLQCCEKSSRKIVENRKFFLEHMVKLESEKKYVLKQEELAFIFNNHNFELELHYVKLKNELLGLHATKIPQTGFTFYDFLTTSDHAASILIQNSSIQKYCSNQVLTKLFPAFSRLMRDRYSAGIHRTDLSNEKYSIACIQKVFFPRTYDYQNQYLIFDCVQKLLKFLNNRDLKHLMKACDIS